MISIRISEDAIRDLDDGFAFYEAQDPGLGDYFATCLRADIESLRVFAGIHRIVYRDYHRLLSRVFPYGVFYTIETDSRLFGRFWIYDETLSGSGTGYWDDIEP